VRSLATGLLLGVAALATLGPVTGCSQDCTDRGGRDQVILELPAGRLGAEAEAVRVCGGDRCREFPLADEVPVPVQGAISESGRLRVRVVLLGSDGEPQRRAERGVALERVRPNGEGCDPEVWNGRLRFDPDQGTLTPL
jgi:hypothetical protein